MPRPTDGVPPDAAGGHAPDGVGLPDLPNPNGSAPFPELSPPNDEASTGITTAGVELDSLLPDFFFLEI